MCRLSQENQVLSERIIDATFEDDNEFPDEQSMVLRASTIAEEYVSPRFDVEEVSIESSESIEASGRQQLIKDDEWLHAISNPDHVSTPTGHDETRACMTPSTGGTSGTDSNRRSQKSKGLHNLALYLEH